MQILTVLVALVQNFTNAELKQTKKIVFRSGVKGKMQRLLILIIEKKVTDVNLLISKLYQVNNSKSEDSFRKLCDRLLEVIYSVLNNKEVFVSERNLYSDPYFNRKLIYQKIELIYTIANKNVPSEWVLKMIESVERNAKQFEFLDELQGLLRFKINYCADNNLFKKYEEASLEYKKNLRYCELNDISDQYLCKYIAFVQHLSIDDKSKIDEMECALQKLDEFYNETKLIYVLWRKLMVELQLSHYKEDFEKAEEIILNLIQLTERESPIKNFGRISQSYMNLAFTQFYLFKFQAAYENSLKAVRKVVTGKIFQNLSNESAVFALIYLKRPAEAGEMLADILSSELIGNTSAQLAKRNLMMAFLKYLQKDYKGAFKYLQKTKEIETDKEGWNLGIRMLNIYLTLSTDKVDLADQRISSMRKHIERTVKQRNMRKRDVVIFRVLSHLSRSGFDFADTWTERQKDFQLLKSDLPDYKWVPRSHELIIFDQWFEAKMNGVEYDPVFPSPKPNTVVEKN